MVRLFSTAAVENLNAVIYVWGIDIPEAGGTENEHRVTGITDVTDMVHIVQGLESQLNRPGFIFCIGLVRAQRIIRRDDAAASIAGASIAGAGPGQHALIGFARVLAMEYPDLRVKTVDLNSGHPVKASQDLMLELSAGDKETEIAIRSGVRYVNRLVKGGKPATAPAGRINTNWTFQPENQSFVEIPRVAPGRGQVEIAVYTASLSLDRDAAPEGRALGQAPSGPSGILARCAGVVTAVGRKVTAFHQGQTVAVLPPVPGLRSFLTVDETIVAPVPHTMGLRTAATLPDWIAAHHALFTVGRLRPGEQVLIHHGADSVCLAAIHLALWCGATVHATEWSEKKRDHLRSQGVDRVYDSGTTQFFDRISGQPGEKGVDLVVGKATGGIMRKSMELLARGGRYVHLSKPSALRNQWFLLDAVSGGHRLDIVDIDTLCRENPGAIEEDLRRLNETLSAHEIPDLSPHVHSVSKLKSLLRDLTTGDPAGNPVVEIHGEPVPLSRRMLTGLIRRDAGYIVTGGFSGLGLAAQKWLADHHADHIAVLSRSGPTTPDAADTLSGLKESGVRVLDLRADIADRRALTRAIQGVREQFPAIKGVIHSAASIDDSAINTLTASQIHRVMAAKALGAWNLHLALADDALDFFILFSSITGLLGNPGQANYAAANAFLDGLAQYRRSQGLTALSINWGVISDVGMVARDTNLSRHLERSGLSGIPSDQALAEMGRAMSEDRTQTGIFRMDWTQWINRSPSGAQHLCELISSSQATQDRPAAFRAGIAALPPAERPTAVYAAVVQMISSVCDIQQSRIEQHTSLTELGLDSLMATELTQTIRARSGVRFRTLYILRGPTPAELSDLILKTIFSDDPESLVAVK
jgi:NADPH:quinone reductase-like Zn-dependent oxidoreductase/acyl carrier protein